MSEITIQTGYAAGRRELASSLMTELADDPYAPEVMRRMLWSSAWVGPDGCPQPFFPCDKWKYRTAVVGFEPVALTLDSIKSQYLRVQTTTNWMLNLQPFADMEAYFATLSKKMRKQLRWLDNVYKRESVQVIPIRTEQDILAFIDIFKTQWPDSDWSGRLTSSFVRFFLALEALGQHRSFLLRTSDGIDVAGMMGYMTDHAYNLDLLARRVGTMEKFSPGFYLTYWMVKYFLEEEGTDWIVFGPGEYEYKKRFRATPIPIYRYEQKVWQNWMGLMRIKNRYRKEKRKEWNNKKS